ncbi:hydantoinase B/oxoprolinase family protein [Candidatus Spongiisocius sp.]|uniref:hydantoinase B/oxoprolinase family protein n=1 Tax=Candidatus Spongiisocius sp. TaxID=3101273 RepID=UPI003B5A572C
MKPDPITIEILRNAFIMAAEEMNAALIRSAYTPVIYESKDCAVALIDSNHRVLGQSSGVPLFLGNLEACTLATEEMYGRSVWGQGDIWIMNDAYLTGTHMHDVTVFAPIFYQGDLAGFAASRAHWLDIGAKDPGVPMDSTEIFQEGVRLPPTLVVRNGEPVEDIWSIIESNVRFPRSAIGDMTAQFAVASIGEHRLGALFDRYGRDTVEAAAEEIFRQSEQLDREAIRAIPDGEYTAEGFLDSDGVGHEPVRIKVRITVEGERLLFDLTGTDGPGRGPINCGAVQTLSACRLAFKYLFNSHQPVNGGTFRPLEVKTKPGSILDARSPAACQFYFTPLGLMIDLICKALSPVLAGTVPAAHYGDGMIFQFTGINPRTEELFLDNEPHVGGWGASRGQDGEDGMIWTLSGNFHDMPIEVFESKFPARITDYGYRQDSAGPGRWRGGNGIIREYQMTTDTEMSLWFERSGNPAWGLLGGKDGAPPDVVINPGTPDETRRLKTNRMPLRKGDTVRCFTGGGGGYGDPLDRDPEAVQADLADGHISADYARRHHGIDYESLNIS